MPNLLQRAWWRLSGRGRVIQLPPLVRQKVAQRALLLYLNEWWNPLEYWRKKSSHQNLHQARDIALLLQERGYACDVVHYKNKQFTVDRPYDLIISHRFDDRFLRVAKPAGARYLCLATTQAPQVHNAISRRRHDEVSRRRKGSLSHFRDVSENLTFLQHADAIAAFGDAMVAEGWSRNFSGPVRTFNNWPFEIPQPQKKDWGRAKTGFLFLASGSQVHKGLDLLLEAAQRLPQARIYVCSYFKTEKDFGALYHKELFESPNVFPVGRINIRSAQFQRLLADTAFAILPSASEGSPGSIIQCAHGGLIPVISHYCGSRWPESRLIEELTVDSVTRAMEECLAMSTEAIQQLSHAVQQRVEQECSREAFRRRWEEILDEIAGPVDIMQP
ncbi:MAG TPA: glycosyltransferase [Chthoniobacter sp.]|nr:glycosyltransferase [Chthoniobacter sp.]